MKILLVDDDILIIRGLRSHIESLQAGYTIVGDAREGKTALKLIDQYQPDLLISDVKMPIMDGIELVKKLREEDNPVKVLMLSGYNEYQYLRESIRCSAVDYLLKPINLSEFDRILYEVKTELEAEIRQKEMNLARDLNRSAQDETRFLHYLEGTGKHLSVDRLDYCGQYLLAVFSFDWMPEVCSIDYEPTALKIQETRDMLEEFFAGKSGIAYVPCTMSGDLFLLVGMEGDGRSKQERCNGYFQELRGLIAQYACLPVTCAVSKPFSSLEGVLPSLRDVRALLVQRFYGKKDSTIFGDPIACFSGELDHIKLEALIGKVCNCMLLRELPPLQKSLEKVFDFLEAARVHPTIFTNALLHLLDSVYAASRGLQKVCVDTISMRDTLVEAVEKSKVLTILRRNLLDCFWKNPVFFGTASRTAAY